MVVLIHRHYRAIHRVEALVKFRRIQVHSDMNQYRPIPHSLVMVSSRSFSRLDHKKHRTMAAHMMIMRAFMTNEMKLMNHTNKFGGDERSSHRLLSYLKQNYSLDV